MFYVYILILSNKQLYTGYTSDLKRRVKEHKCGKVKFTSKRLPVKLIYYEAYISQIDARKREKYLKTSDGKAQIKIMLKDFLSNID